MEFEVGKVYDRRKDIHAIYNGQRQGGISTPKDCPYIFLFTGESGQQYGYQDGLDKDGVYLYTGEGQQGPMKFIRGNLSIRDHAINGKDLLLFSALGKNRGYRFLGIYSCANYQLRKAPDREGLIREVIVFHLVPVNHEQEDQLEVDGASEIASIEMLRQKAYEASVSEKGVAGRQAKTVYWKRSKAVKDYVLARAGGICESCKRPAPFNRIGGSPYLEPHHTRRLTDGGPDHPKWVGAICPNCHREIHFGLNGAELNKNLQNYITSKEP